MENFCPRPASHIVDLYTMRGIPLVTSISLWMLSYNLGIVFCLFSLIYLCIPLILCTTGYINRTSLKLCLSKCAWFSHISAAKFACFIEKLHSDPQQRVLFLTEDMVSFVLDHWSEVLDGWWKFEQRGKKKKSEQFSLKINKQTKGLTS